MSLSSNSGHGRAKSLSLQSLSNSELFRYGLASVLALAADMAVFSLMLRVGGVGHFSAATAGFVAGATVAYMISVTWVFSRRTMRQHPALEALTFVVIGLGGLAVTQAVLWIGVDRLHLVPEFVKLMAAGATFLFNFAVRKLLLFRSAGMSFSPDSTLV